MSKTNIFSRTLIGTAAAALMAASLAGAGSTPALAQTTLSQPSNDVTLSVGTGQLVRFDGNISDLFIANPAIADVQVRSSNQLYIFGKGAGETTLYATNSAGRVVYSANVRVGNNIASVDEMLGVAMPRADIKVTPMNGFLLLTGTVATPSDVEDASRLVEAFVGGGTQVFNRLKTATPMQVMLKVTIAEVSRSVLKNVGVNIASQDPGGSNDIGGGFGRGGDFGSFTPGGGFNFIQPEGTSAAGIVFGALGLDIAAQINATETSGLATILAEPTLVALSGETASFLAGGEFPIPVSNGINGTSIEFKSYGVGLAFTPTVLEGGRISMRVLPEVSEISSEGAITVDGFEIPGLITRRTETTVELGSGQSFMISGLMRNNANNSVERTPFLGNLPVIGALFRSNSYRRNLTELVVVITPYLVKPVHASQIALPTDGFRTANDAERLLLDKMHDSRNDSTRPMPVLAPPQTVTPGIAGGSAQAAPNKAPAQQSAAAKPGFNF